MKKLVLVAIVAAGAWWYFSGGRALSEEQVNGFYRDQQQATFARDPAALCTQLDEKFESTGTVSIGGRSRTSTQNRAETCDGYSQLYDTFEKIGQQMNGMVQLDSGYEIHSIEISPDKKTATVDISTSLDVAGSMMNIRSRSTDTLIRRNGKVLMLRSEGEGSIGGGGT